MTKRQRVYYTEHDYIKPFKPTDEQVRKDALLDLHLMKRSNEPIRMRKRVKIGTGISKPFILNVLMMTEGMTLTEARKMSIEDKLAYVYLLIK